jgi:hypothetical protein
MDIEKMDLKDIQKFLEEAKEGSETSLSKKALEELNQSQGFGRNSGNLVFSGKRSSRITEFIDRQSLGGEK